MTDPRWNARGNVVERDGDEIWLYVAPLHDDETRDRRHAFAPVVADALNSVDDARAAVDAANQRAEQAEEALYTFLDALVVAKQNDDVMSVVDAMLETYVQGALVADQPDPEEDT